MSTAQTASVPTQKSLTVMLWLVATGFFMQTLDSTIVNTALPAMATSLGELPLRMQSVVIAYSLTMAVMIPVSGWLDAVRPPALAAGSAGSAWTARFP